MIETSVNLTPSDLESLQASFITPQIAHAARLRRVTDLDGSEIVGRKRDAGADYSGVLFPYFHPADMKNPREYRLRRDSPDYERNGNGEVKEKAKYLTPPGRSNMVYIVPGTADLLTDVRVPIVIAEGEKKALALYRLSLTDDRPRFVPIGLVGVWGFRGKVGKTTKPNGSKADVKGIIPDFDLISWSDRTVFILFDPNVNTNESVWFARNTLARELSGRGSNVLYTDLPSDCGLNGVDDYLGRIERNNGTDAAIETGIDLLRRSVPFENAKPIFIEAPRPLDQTLRPVEDLTPECLPGILQDWLTAAATVIGCPIDFLALSAITIAGSLIGPRVRIKPILNSNWFVVPNIYAGIVGLPSTKKSPALDEARKPLLRLQAIARQIYATKKADYEIEARYFEKDEKDVRNKSKTADEYKNRLASMSKPSRPTLRRFETNDATSPKMIQFLSENPNGMVLTRDELTGWLKSLEAEYDQASRAFYLELWKGAITYDHGRVSENRDVVLTSGTLSIIGGIQPSRLQHYISEAYSYDNADGFPQRFLFAYPNPRRQLSNPTQSDYEQLERGLEAACSVFQTLAEKEYGGRAVSDSGDTFYPITFDSSAQAAFNEWKDDTEAEANRIESEDEVFASFLNKLPKSCAAIALIFHCFENSTTAPLPDRVSLETTIRALSYIEILTTHARRVFALGENRIFALAQIVLGKIRTGKLVSGFTAREVKRKGWSGLSSGEMIQDVLGVLMDYGYLRTVESDAGRPTARYYIHPAIEIEASDEVEE